MTISTTSLTRTAGIAAVVGGLLYVAVQINHPLLDLDLVTTTEWKVRQSMKIGFTILSLAGITGMYLRQVRQTGVLGLIGYVVLALGFVFMGSIEVVGGVVLPAIAGSSPGFVTDVLAVAVPGGQAAGDLGLLQQLIQIDGVLYLAGGLLFGIALFRAGVLARWAAALLALSTVATLAIPFLPQVNFRLFAIPTGVAIAALGFSLWRDQRTAGTGSRREAGAPASRPSQHHVTTHLAGGPNPRTRLTRSTWSTRSAGWVPVALIAVVLIPAIAGTLRVVELFGGPLLLPANPRMTASPAPVVVHIISALTYAFLGAFQFSSRFRRRYPRWHRAAGRVLVGAGLTVASSALWMTVFYPRQPGTGDLAYLLRLAFAAGMGASLILAFAAIRRRNIGCHQAWMTRAYALALGAGTQTFTLGVGAAVFGTRELTTDLSLGAGWAINLAIAEIIIRRRTRTRTRSLRVTTTVATHD